MKYTVKEFAQEIRKRYPGDYDDLSDRKLTDLWLKKYPKDIEKIDFRSKNTISIDYKEAKENSPDYIGIITNLVGILIKVIFVLAMIVSVLGIFVLIYGNDTKCPNCKKWWKRKLINKELVDTSGGYRTIKREDIHQDKTGKEIGKTTRLEQVHVVVYTFENFYRCKNCSHNWSLITSDEHQG